MKSGGGRLYKARISCQYVFVMNREAEFPGTASTVPASPGGDGARGVWVTLVKDIRKMKFRGGDQRRTHVEGRIELSNEQQDRGAGQSRTIPGAEAIRRHVKAVTVMLLGSRRLKPTVVITAGDPIGLEVLTFLGRTARAANVDVVHLAFDDTAAGCCLTDISVIVPRGRMCYVQRGCKLWQSKAGGRSVILPRPECRGMFRLSPGEILHIDGKPEDVDAGIARAEARLRALVTRGVCIDGQIDVREVPLAA